MILFQNLIQVCSKLTYKILTTSVFLYSKCVHCYCLILQTRIFYTLRRLCNDYECLRYHLIAFNMREAH